MKATGYTRRLFTAADDAFLRKNYYVLGIALCAQQLDRKKASIRARAQKLGVAKTLGPRKLQYVSHVGRPQPRSGTTVQPTATPVALPPERWLRLAAFDKPTARACREIAEGLPPGKLINGGTVGYE